MLDEIGRFVYELLIVGTVLAGVRSLFNRWIAEKLIHFIQRNFIKTEREVAIWLHYRNKRLDKNHQHPIAKCDDGKCAIL